MHRLHALTRDIHYKYYLRNLDGDYIYVVWYDDFPYLGDAHTAKNHLQASKWTRTVTNTSCCPTWQLEGSSPRWTYICMYYIIT